MSRTTAPATLQLVEIAGIADRAVATVALGGEIDTLTAPRAHSELAELLDRPAIRTVVLDLEGVTFLGSAGVGMLLQTATDAADKAVELRLVADSTGPVLRTLRMMNLAHNLPFQPTPGPARSDWRRTG